MKPFKIAVVSTLYTPSTHTDVIVSRWLKKRDGDADWGWHGTDTQIASLFVVQNARTGSPKPLLTPDDIGMDVLEDGVERRDVDLSGSVNEAYGIPLFDNVHDALTMGTGTLAVDGVILIGEHGEYPVNDIGQMLYPRYELFCEIVDVYRQTGRTAPVFCDKHYSYDWEKAKQMVQTADTMGFLLWGASSQPLWKQSPPLPSLPEKHITEVLSVYQANFAADSDVYGYHSIEFAQSLVEQRYGGETGVVNAIAYRDDEMWRQFDTGALPLDLLDAVLRVTSPDGIVPDRYREAVRETGREPDVVVLEHADGLRVIHVNLCGGTAGNGIALRIEADIVATGSIPGVGREHYPHFAALSAQIVQGLTTGVAPIPRKRALLTTGLTEASMRALSQAGVPLATTHLSHLSYNAAER